MPLAEELLFGPLQKGGNVTVGVNADETDLSLTFDKAADRPVQKTDKETAG